MEHILAIQDLAGPEAVAFGSDFDGVPDLPAGICDCRGLRLVSDRLLEKGIGRAEVERLCWSNFLRVFKAVCG
jgi:membrane dipeptidase